MQETTEQQTAEREALLRIGQAVLNLGGTFEHVLAQHDAEILRIAAQLRDPVGPFIHPCQERLAACLTENVARNPDAVSIDKAFHAADEVHEQFVGVFQALLHFALAHAQPPESGGRCPAALIGKLQGAGRHVTKALLDRFLVGVEIFRRPAQFLIGLDAKPGTPCVSIEIAKLV
jgi:hypothetical protein